MKYCSQCDKQYPDDNQFCPECGHQLQAESQKETAPRSGASGGRGQQARGRGRQGQQAQTDPARQQQQPPRSNGGQAQPAGSQAKDPSSGSVGARNDQVELIGRNFFGEYTIVDRLGEGGMGAVYLAEQNSIDQKIALKVLHAESAESDEIVQRFHREAKVISMLTHPNIVRVFIFGRTDDDLLFLAMEFVEGVELREKLDGSPVDELMAIKITKQVCSAVAAAHDQDIIHRDLKPENILLKTHRGEDNYVKILDFGIAKLKHPDGQQGPQLTQAGIVYGTPEYLSPEQAQADDLDHRTDIYALGCILFEMMTGRVPFDANSSVEILKQKVFEDPPKPSDHAPVAPKMEEIIMTAMAQDRDDRYDSALEMFDALVVREQELQSERQLDRRDTYVPGSELTGHHQLEALANETGAASDSSGAIATAGEGAGSQHDIEVGQPDIGELDETVSTSAPSAEELAQQAPSHQQQQQQQPQSQQQQHRDHPQQGQGEPGTRGQQQTGGDPSRSNAMSQQPQQRRASPQNSAQDQSQDSQTDLVRYALMATVVVLAFAVTGLFVYLITILAG